MKSFFKRSAISIVVLGMASASYAHHNTSSVMWGPHVTGAFLGVEGLDMRPQNGDLDWVTYRPTPLITGSPFKTDSISTSYDWSWRVYAGITFSDCDDLTFSWFHINDSDHASLAPPISSGVTFFPRFINDSFADPGILNARVTFDVDEAYVVWGHTIKFNNPWSIRFAGGVEYAKVESDMTVNVANTTTTIVGYTADSETRGWGPRLEFDAVYHLSPCFSWFAKTNLALISSTREVSLDGAVVPETSETTFFDGEWTTRHIVIPKVGMRLGVSYDWLWGQAGSEGCGGCGSMFGIEVGWQADAYIHAIERPVDGFFVTPSTFGDVDTKVSNFTDQGWYIGVKVGMGWL